MDFQNKVAVVTGGVQGIGKTIAEEFEKAGAAVCVIDRQPGGYFTGDLAQEETILRFTEKLAAEYGRLDFLVNNAGMTYKCLAQDFPSQMYQKIQKLNLETMFELCQICYHYIIEVKHKNLQNVFV